MALNAIAGEKMMAELAQQYSGRHTGRVVASTFCAMLSIGCRIKQITIACTSCAGCMIETRSGRLAETMANEACKLWYLVEASIEETFSFCQLGLRHHKHLKWACKEFCVNGFSLKSSAVSLQT
jgi:hypothetical protein